jgi:phospholipid/cholesterol/gamma-HCH transport system substrate-binding protein
MNTRYITLGTFVVVTLGAFGWLALQLGLGDRDGTHYTVRTPDAAGLVEGNSVRIAGVEVGKVGSIHVDGNVAVIDIRIRKGTPVHKDACAAVHIKGMLGEKYLGIAQAQTGEPMPAGATFDCVTATVDFDNALNATKEMVYGDESLLPPITRVAHRIDKFTAALDEGTDENSPRGRLDKMLGTAEKLLATTGEMLDENRGDLRAMAMTGRKRLEDPRIDKILDGTVKLLDNVNRRLPAMLDQGERTLAKLEKAADLLDDQHIAQIDGMLDDGAAALKNLRKLSDDFKDVGKDLKPALKSVAPLLKDLGTIAHRAASITEGTIRQFFQMEGFRVRLGQGKEAREFLKESEKGD